MEDANEAAAGMPITVDAICADLRHIFVSVVVEGLRELAAQSAGIWGALLAASCDKLCFLFN